MLRQRHHKCGALAVGAALVFAAACTDGAETANPMTDPPSSTIAIPRSGAPDLAGTDLEAAITNLCNDLSAPWQTLQADAGDVDLANLRSTVDALTTDLRQVRDAAAAAAPGENEPLEQAVNSFERSLTSLEDAVGALLAVDLEAAGQNFQQAVEAMDTAQQSAVDGGVEACGAQGEGSGTESTSEKTVRPQPDATSAGEAS